jgi:hypothetical protein
MPWYLNLHDKQDVLSFTKFLTNHAGHEWKKIMPQLLRIRQMQLKNDSIQGTWQARTTEEKIAEILCNYGHGRKGTGHNPDGTTYEVELSQFFKDIQEALGRWLPTVIEQTVAETDASPGYSDARDPRYFAIAATKLANNRAVAAKGPLTRNSSIDMILALMGSVGDKYDPDLEEFYVQFRRYAAQQAAKQYEEEVAAQDKARLDKTAAKTIKSMRDHQKMKLDGSGLKGAHESGKFWLLGRAIDGMPILLVSSKEEKAIDGTYISQAGGLASGSNPGMCTGTFSQDKKAGRIFFILEQGQTQTPVLVSALSSMGVERDSVILLPAGRSAWAAATAAPAAAAAPSLSPRK